MTTAIADTKVDKTDKLVSLNDAMEIAERITGETCSKSAIYSWRRTGILGVKLECRVVMGKIRTSERSLRSFLDRVERARNAKIKA